MTKIIKKFSNFGVCWTLITKSNGVCWDPHMCRLSVDCQSQLCYFPPTLPACRALQRSMVAIAHQKER